jgi:hypothetical protein
VNGARYVGCLINVPLARLIEGVLQFSNSHFLPACCFVSCVLTRHQQGLNRCYPAGEAPAVACNGTITDGLCEEQRCELYDITRECLLGRSCVCGRLCWVFVGRVCDVLLDIDSLMARIYIRGLFSRIR